jgi:hypothetical protein
MIKKVIDIVNFNADASCLASSKWLSFLEGGVDSVLYQWLQNYVKYQKKVSLGFTGATISDIKSFNSVSIDLINQHRDLFEIILRPYAHDMGLLRSKMGFEENLNMGRAVIEQEFQTYTPYYLPPEFMLTNEQIFILHANAVKGTFIKPLRFSKEIKSRIPTVPYYIKGLYDTTVECISFNEVSYHAYLKTIQLFDNSWNEAILAQPEAMVFSWRDGESPFFLNDTAQREAYWLEHESTDIARCFLSECLPQLTFEQNESLPENSYHYYPVHSITPWMREMKMMGFISRLQQLETRLPTFTAQEKYWWLQVINSDILSAIEKNSPLIHVKNQPTDTDTQEHFIWRSERGMEGEEIVSMLEFGIDHDDISHYINNTKNPHITKLSARIAYLTGLSPEQKKD